MADDVRRDPDAVGRCPPYPRLPIGSSAPDTRFAKAPHLTLLVLSPEHVGAILKGERIVRAPPSASPLAAWLTSGDPEDFQGTLVISWVFYRHMSVRDTAGQYMYDPFFFARVSSEGIAPFTMVMNKEWHERANGTMALPACGRSVHHVPLSWVLPMILLKAQRDLPPYPEWEFELLTQEVVIHRHCLRASKPLVGAPIYDVRDVCSSWEDFGPPPPQDLGRR